MAVIRLEHARPTDVLAEDVYAADRRLLAGKGLLLTAAMIKRLGSRGVVTVRVTRAPSAEADFTGGAESVLQRFEWVEDQTQMKQLRDMILRVLPLAPHEDDAESQAVADMAAGRSAEDDG